MMTKMAVKSKTWKEKQELQERIEQEISGKTVGQINDEIAKGHLVVDACVIAVRRHDKNILRSRMEVGKALNKAKHDLKGLPMEDQRWKDIVSELEYAQSTISKLMTLGDKEWLLTYEKDLPKNWGNVYEIAQFIDEDQMKGLIKEKKINNEMKKKEVMLLRQEVQGKKEQKVQDTTPPFEMGAILLDDGMSCREIEECERDLEKFLKKYSKVEYESAHPDYIRLYTPTPDENLSEYIEGQYDSDPQKKMWNDVVNATTRKDKQSAIQKLWKIANSTDPSRSPSYQEYASRKRYVMKDPKPWYGVEAQRVLKALATGRLSDYDPDAKGVLQGVTSPE